MYHDCDPDDAQAAYARLRRQCFVTAELPPLADRPNAECVAIFATDDRMLPLEWGRRAATQILGVTAIEIPGGHSPFLAAPALLADLLMTGL
jgi:hypothetical protein